MIGKVVKVTGAAAAKGGEETSVNGIASGIKGIVEAAEKAGEEGKLESEAAGAAGEANEDAGKLFALRMLMLLMGVVVLGMQRRLLLQLVRLVESRY
ncbi:variable large family protein [Borreliella burgdorferi]|uniref:variable large family protein n=1 Tax=Borreliella burgdorferi TaxID=139 RepID=UPI001E54E52A|nr:variable large family protein [Borreliella burgdorferi]